MTKNFSLDRFKILSGSILKLIAVVSMFFDHAALLLTPHFPFMSEPLFNLFSYEITAYFIIRKIGRLAFPIFCFLITEGYRHTKNKERYAFNLLLFAFISEIPFNLMKTGKFFTLDYQNVFFTLLLGVLMIYVTEKEYKERLKAVLLIGLAIVALFLNCDYGLKGVLLILLLHILKNHPAAQAVLAYPLLSGGIAAFAAFLPINMYNGKRGFIKSSWMKYAFYVFYPIHIVVLVSVKLIFL